MKQKDNVDSKKRPARPAISVISAISAISAILTNRVFRPQDRRSVPRHRESTPDAEALALRQALPRRKIIGFIDRGMRYVLECGHAISSNASLDPEVCTGCRECYYGDMCAAQRMIEAESL